MKIKNHKQNKINPDLGSGIELKELTISLKKEQIANELFNNSKNKFIKKILAEYLNNKKAIEDKVLVRLDYCINYIESIGFNINGYGLWEIPTHYSYNFFNEKEKKQFDIAVWSKEDLKPRFLDDNFNEKNANSIDEAIEKYNKLAF